MPLSLTTHSGAAGCSETPAHALAELTRLSTFSGAIRGNHERLLNRADDLSLVYPFEAYWKRFVDVTIEVAPPAVPGESNDPNNWTEDVWHLASRCSLETWTDTALVFRFNGRVRRQ